MNASFALLSSPVVAVPAAPACNGRLLLALAASALLAACGGGGGGGGAGANGNVGTGDAAAARAAYFASLEGSWAMTGSDLVIGGSVPIPTGLESNVVTLDAFQTEKIEGTVDSYACVYKLSVPGMDFTSPSFGPQLSAVGVAVHPQPAGAPFWLGGLAYRPADDITIEFGIVFALEDAAAGGAPAVFSARYEFQAYDGYQLESVEVNEPGVDDDLDGVIDEPGEFALEDRIAPTAVQLDAGGITVEFRRLGA